jgi:hypothetical protein
MISLLLSGLLAATSLVAALVWNEWPAATARQFVLDCGQSSIADADLPLLMPSPEDRALRSRVGEWLDTQAYGLDGFRRMIQRNPDAVVLEPQPRTLADRCRGRLTVTVSGEQGRFRIWIERGQIVHGPAPAYMYGGQEFTLDVF